MSQTRLGGRPAPRGLKRHLRRGARLGAAAVVLGGATVISLSAGLTSAGASTKTASAASACKGKGVVPPSEVAAVKAAETNSTPWAGPKSSPKPPKNLTIVDVSQDETNAGNDGVANGLAQAAKVLGWGYKEIDGNATLSGMVSALNQAIALKPAAIALESVPTDGTTPELKKAAADGIALIGWHVANDPGKIKGTPLFWNVSTSPFQIAEIAADYAIVASCGEAHAIELTDMTYPIDVEKNAGFDAAFKLSKTSSIKIDNYPFGSRSTLTGPQVTAITQKDPDVNWFLTINDSYFDYAIPTLRSDGIQPGSLNLDSAGDGSPSAFQRIRENSWQVATVPEPLNEQGWIMADEIDRAVNHKPPFNFVTKVHLTVHSNVNDDGGAKNVYTPGDNYQARFTKLWGK
jgi:ribose transport system substrate-binding protein